MVLQVLESGLVAPNEETPRHGIWLSNLDLVAARGYTPTIYAYQSPGVPGYFSAEALKAALAKALTIFYPLAGRLGRDQTGRIEIDCTGEGAYFTVARSDYTIHEFNDFAPSAEVCKEFVPATPFADPPCNMMMLQATSLKCGGLVLGFAVHHYAHDGRGATLFIRTFSALARGDNAAVMSPFLDRTLLRARSPPAVLFDHADYSPTLFEAGTGGPAPTVVTANLALSKEQLHSLKKQCSDGSPTATGVSTFRAIVAHVWRCMCIARGLSTDAETQLYLPVDLRERLRPPLPANYNGNPTIRTKATAKVNELLSNPLSFGTGRVQEAVDRVTDEYARSLIDHLETVNIEGLSKRGAMPRTSLCAVSWLGMPMYDANFGWGEPVCMARAQMYGAGFVYLLRSPSGDGGARVILGLEQDSMVVFKNIFYEEQ